MNENNKYENLQLLKEMVESMTGSIETMIEVGEEQKELIEIVESSDKKDKFKSFLDGIKEDINDRKQQIGVVTKQRDVLAEVCNLADENEDVAEVVEKILIGLRVFNR